MCGIKMFSNHIIKISLSCITWICTAEQCLLFIPASSGWNGSRWLPHDCKHQVVFVVCVHLSASRRSSVVTTTARVRWTNGPPASWSAASHSWWNRANHINTSVCFRLCCFRSNIISTFKREENELSLWLHPKSDAGESVRRKILEIDYKFVYTVTCAVMQKIGAGLHTANSCYWDTAMDGKQLTLTCQENDGQIDQRPHYRKTLTNCLLRL